MKCLVRHPRLCPWWSSSGSGAIMFHQRFQHFFGGKTNAEFSTIHQQIRGWSKNVSLLIFRAFARNEEHLSKCLKINWTGCDRNKRTIRLEIVDILMHWFESITHWFEWLCLGFESGKGIKSKLSQIVTGGCIVQAKQRPFINFADIQNVVFSRKINK